MSHDFTLIHAEELFLLPRVFIRLDEHVDADGFLLVDGLYFERVIQG